MENIPETKTVFREKMLAFIKSHAWAMGGTVLGGIGGYIYYRSVGCSTGACMITSNPWLTMLWGATVGYLLGSTLKPEKKNIQKNEKEHGID
jgi:hypothetical protein